MFRSLEPFARNSKLRRVNPSNPTESRHRVGISLRRLQLYSTRRRHLPITPSNITKLYSTPPFDAMRSGAPRCPMAFGFGWFGTRLLSSFIYYPSDDVDVSAGTTSPVAFLDVWTRLRRRRQLYAFILIASCTASRPSTRPHLRLSTSLTPLSLHPSVRPPADARSDVYSRLRSDAHPPPGLYLHRTPNRPHTTRSGAHSPYIGHPTVLGGDPYHPSTLSTP
jgi:hypothetical protein